MNLILENSLSRFHKTSLYQIALIPIIFIAIRIYSIQNGLTFDGDRLVDTFMQFPDRNLLNWGNFINVLFNFHFSAPGLPLTYIVLESIGGSYWDMLSWATISLLALAANIFFYLFFVRIGVGKWSSLLLTLIFLTLNPSLILYEAQFYSTAFVAYTLVILFYLFAFKDIRTWWLSLICILLLSALGFSRSSYLLLIISPLSLYILLKIRATTRFRFLALIAGSSLLLMPISAQLSRVINYQQFTLQSSGATGVILGLSSYQTFQGLPYAKSGYFPFGEIVANDPSGGNNVKLDINKDLRKSNGLPNWNSDDYLQGYMLDSKHLIGVLYQNKSLLPYFFRDSLGWSATNPACSRVITVENYKAVSFLDEGFRDVLMLRTPFVKSNSQLDTCGGLSKFDLTYLLLLFFYIFMIIRVGLRFRKFRSKLASGPTGALFHLLVLSSIVFSLLNGSPETSKYRVEFEPYLVMFVLFYLLNQSQTKGLFRRRVGRVN
jgi:hypothetical protein